MTNLKTTDNSIATRNLVDFEKGTDNVYEGIVVIAKRSNQIAAGIKEELKEKLEEFQTSSDNLEEVFENREQIEISKYYERLPKPVLVAINEFQDDKIYFRKQENTTPQ